MQIISKSGMDISLVSYFIDETKKIVLSNYHRIGFDVILYPLSFSANTPFNIFFALRIYSTVVCIISWFSEENA